MFGGYSVPGAFMPSSATIPSTQLPGEMLNVSLPQHFMQPPSIPLLPYANDPTSNAVRNLTAEEAASLGGMMAAGKNEDEALQKRNKHLRKAAGSVWNDPSLDEWPEDDHRIFCGDLGNEVTDEILGNAFKKYPSFLKAKVIRYRRGAKTKGYGFVSFHNAEDMLLALKEMNKKYVGNRPIRVMKSKWREREINSEKNKDLGNILDSVVTNNCRTLRKFKKFAKKGIGKGKSKTENSDQSSSSSSASTFY